MIYGNTKQKVIQSLRFYFCEMRKETVHYIDIYSFFDKKLKEKVGKSRVREIIIELEHQGVIKTIDPQEIARGRPRKQICLSTIANNPILAIR